MIRRTFNENKSTNLAISTSLGLAIGAGIGIAVGTATNNLALWMSIGVGCGLAIGASIGALIDNQKNKNIPELKLRKHNTYGAVNSNITKKRIQDSDVLKVRDK